MRTTRPAARPTLAFHELRAHPLHMLLACFGLLHGRYPANPFIPGQRGDVLPSRMRLWRREKRLSQIHWYRMQSARREPFAAHVTMITSDLGGIDKKAEKWSQVLMLVQKMNPTPFLSTGNDLCRFTHSAESVPIAASDWVDRFPCCRRNTSPSPRADRSPR